MLINSLQVLYFNTDSNSASFMQQSLLNLFHFVTNSASLFQMSQCLPHAVSPSGSVLYLSTHFFIVWNELCLRRQSRKLHRILVWKPERYEIDNKIYDRKNKWVCVLVFSGHLNGRGLREGLGLGWRTWFNDSLELNGSGFEPRWVKEMCSSLHTSRTEQKSSKPPTRIPELFREGKAAWTWRWPCTPV